MRRFAPFGRWRREAFATSCRHRRSSGRRTHSCRKRVALVGRQVWMRVLSPELDAVLVLVSRGSCGCNGRWRRGNEDVLVEAHRIVWRNDVRAGPVVLGHPRPDAVLLVGCGDGRYGRRLISESEDRVRRHLRVVFAFLGHLPLFLHHPLQVLQELPRRRNGAPGRRQLLRNRLLERRAQRIDSFRRSRRFWRLWWRIHRRRRRTAGDALVERDPSGLFNRTLRCRKRRRCWHGRVGVDRLIADAVSPRNGNYRRFGRHCRSARLQTRFQRSGHAGWRACRTRRFGSQNARRHWMLEGGKQVGRRQRERGRSAIHLVEGFRRWRR